MTWHHQGVFVAREHWPMLAVRFNWFAHALCQLQFENFANNNGARDLFCQYPLWHSLTHCDIHCHHKPSIIDNVKWCCVPWTTLFGLSLWWLEKSPRSGSAEKFCARSHWLLLGEQAIPTQHQRLHFTTTPCWLWEPPAQVAFYLVSFQTQVCQ